MKKIIVSVTNDLSGDNRVYKVCLTLAGMGFNILLTGRKLPDSLPLAERGYATHRMWLLFRKGPLFYAEYNFRLFLYLLFNRFDLLLSNDLDTLPANFMAARLKRKPLIYDSHEYFTEVPELIGRPWVKKIWEWLERKMVPTVNAAYTVSNGIAEIFSEKYHIPFKVVRNLPFSSGDKSGSHSDTQNPKTIIYQGALNLGRGLELAIQAMQFLPEATLLIAGSGDLEEKLHRQVSDSHVENVRFTGKLALEELKSLTLQADLGISLEKDMGLNYRFALPNKLFDYIQSRIPVVVSDLPEMSRIVRQFDIGLINSSNDPEILASVFRTALTDEPLRQKWSVNLEKAAQELTWENEKPVVEKIFRQYL